MIATWDVVKKKNLTVGEYFENEDVLSALPLPKKNLHLLNNNKMSSFLP